MKSAHRVPFLGLDINDFADSVKPGHLTRVKVYAEDYAVHFGFPGLFESVFAVVTAQKPLNRRVFVESDDRIV